MDVIWSPSALLQVSRIVEHLAGVNPYAADQLAAALIEAGDSLAQFPNRGRLVPGSDIRELVVAHPYVIRLRIASNTVRILRVRHGARRPTKALTNP